MPRHPHIALLLVAALPGAAQSPAQTVLITQLLAEQSRTAFTIQGTGGRAVGTGGAFIAVADDATAVSFNPAGLAQLLRPEFSLVGESLKRDQRFRNFRFEDPVNPVSYEDASLLDRRTSPLFFSAAAPYKRGGRNTVVQFSYQRLIDLNFDSRSHFRSQAGPGGTASFVNQAIVQTGGIDLWSLAAATELSPRFLFGLSLNHWRGNWDFDSASTFNEGLPTQVEVNLAQGNEFRGWNYNLGLIWRSRYVNVGLVYRAPFTADYILDTKAFFDRSIGTDVDLPDAHLSTRVKWPESLGWGFAFHPTDRFTLAADLTRTRWSRATFESTGTPFDKANFFDLEVASRTPDTRDRRVGFEWVAFLGDRIVIPVRAGAFEEPQPMLDRRTGQQRVFRGWTAGVGLKFPSLNFDLAYKRSRAAREVTRILGIYASGSDFFPVFAKGREEIQEDRIYLTAIFQLNTQRVHQALRNFFVGE